MAEACVCVCNRVECVCVWPEGCVCVGQVMCVKWPIRKCVAVCECARICTRACMISIIAWNQ